MPQVQKLSCTAYVGQSKKGDLRCCVQKLTRMGPNLTCLHQKYTGVFHDGTGKKDSQANASSVLGVKE
jgi:hypothetical protein